jgi:hypothetical protein
MGILRKSKPQGNVAIIGVFVLKGQMNYPLNVSAIVLNNDSGE